MARVATLVFLLSGCSKWVYAPDFELADQHRAVVEATYRPYAGCGDLVVTNHSPDAVTLRAADVRVVQGDQSWAPNPKRADERIAAGESHTSKLCTDVNPRVIRARPPTAYDFTLWWFMGFGGVLAGNVAWEPDDAKKAKKLPNPGQYDYAVVVPVRAGDDDLELKLPIEADGVVAYKYSRRVYGPR
jgi:hypothetical protein